MYRRSTKQRSSSKSDWRRLVRSRAFSVTIILGIAIMGISLTKEIIRKVQIQRQIQDLEQEINTLEQHNDELNDLIAYFNSSSFQEKEAKIKFNLTAPGETVVVLPESDQSTVAQTNTTVAVTPTTRVSNVQKWINYFFNYN